MRKKPKSKTQKTLRKILDTTVTILIFAACAAAIFALLYLLDLFLGFDLIAYLKTIPYLAPALAYILNQIAAQSFLGVLYLFFFSSHFFFPTPLELVFLGLLAQNSKYMLIATATIVGVVLGQISNYWLGRIFRRLLKPYIKKKRRRWVHQKLKEHGVYAIFFINLIPFIPYPISNFILGMFRYPFSRFFLVLSLAHIVKFFFLMLIFTRYVI